MEFLIFILIVAFLVVNNGKAKNGKNAKAVSAAQKRPRTSDAVDAVAGRAFAKLEALLDEASDQSGAKPALPPRPAGARGRAARPAAFDGAARATAPAAPAQGVSATDGEGCVGGSLPHEHTEGETHAEHRRHVEALQRREAEESLAAQAALDLAAMNVQRLRRAMVMAEVLDRPVALRRGRRRSGERL